MTTTTMLNRNDWRAMNGLYDRMLRVRTLRADLLIKAYSLIPDALVHLENMGFVACYDPVGDVPVGIERALVGRGQRKANGEYRGPADVHLSLTPAGVHWCEHDPDQLTVTAALRFAHDPLWRLFNREAAYPQSVLAAHEQRLVTVSDAALGDEIHRLTPAMVASPPPTWYMHIAPAGRFVLAIP